MAAVSIPKIVLKYPVKFSRSSSPQIRQSRNSGSVRNAQNPSQLYRKLEVRWGSSNSISFRQSDQNFGIADGRQQAPYLLGIPGLNNEFVRLEG
jgi:hypothetical protein